MAEQSASGAAEEKKQHLRKPWKIIDSIISLIFLVVAGYVYAGFYYPDTLELQFNPSLLPRLILWGARLGLPLLAAGALGIYYAVRTGRIAGATVAGLLVALVICVLLVLPVAMHVHDKPLFGKDSERQYHPYLQLSPNELKERPSVSGNPIIKVFCLGGSTTERGDKSGRGWPDRVEEHLNGLVPGKEIQFYNCGREWYTSQHILINYLFNLRHRRPDVIIVMEAINDLLHNADFCYFSGGPFEQDYRHFYGPVSRLVKRKPFFEAMTSMVRSMWYVEPREVVVTDTFAGLVPFERNLRTLIDLARQDSITVVLMTQAHLTKEVMTPEERHALYMLNVEAVGPAKQWAPETALAGLKKYNEVIRQVAASEGVFLVELEGNIPQALDNFSDDVHYRTKGLDVVGERVAAQLEELGVFVQ